MGRRREQWCSQWCLCRTASSSPAPRSCSGFCRPTWAPQRVAAVTGSAKSANCGVDSHTVMRPAGPGRMVAGGSSGNTLDPLQLCCFCYAFLVPCQRPRDHLVFLANILLHDLPMFRHRYLRRKAPRVPSHLKRTLSSPNYSLKVQYA